MKNSITLLILTLVSVLYGCDGQDRFDECYFSGEPVPEYEITIFDTVTGDKICWTESREPEFIGDKGWQYQGPCEYTFADGSSPNATNITVSANGYEAQVIENVSKPYVYLCLLDGEQAIVEGYLSPL